MESTSSSPPPAKKAKAEKKVKGEVMEAAATADESSAPTMANTRSTRSNVLFSQRKASKCTGIFAMKRDTLLCLLKELSFESQIRFKRHMSQAFQSDFPEINAVVDDIWKASKGLLFLMDDTAVPTNFIKMRLAQAEYRIDQQTSVPLLPPLITQSGDLPLASEHQKTISYVTLIRHQMDRPLELADKFYNLSTLKVITRRAEARTLRLVADFFVALNDCQVPLVSLQVIIRENLNTHKYYTNEQSTVAEKQAIATEFNRLVELTFRQEAFFPLLQTLVLYLGHGFFHRYRLNYRLEQPQFTLVDPATMELPLLSRVKHVYLHLPLKAVKANLGRLSRNPSLQMLGLIFNTKRGFVGDIFRHLTFEIMAESSNAVAEAGQPPSQPDGYRALLSKLVHLLESGSKFSKTVPAVLLPHLTSLSHLQLQIPRSGNYRSTLAPLQNLPSLTALNLTLYLSTLIVSEDAVEGLLVRFPTVKTLYLEVCFSYNNHPLLFAQLSHDNFLAQFELERIFRPSLQVLHVTLSSHTRVTNWIREYYACSVCDRNQPNWTLDCCRLMLATLGREMYAQVEELQFKFSYAHQIILINGLLELAAGNIHPL